MNAELGKWMIALAALGGVSCRAEPEDEAADDGIGGLWGSESESDPSQAERGSSQAEDDETADEGGGGLKLDVGGGGTGFSDAGDMPSGCENVDFLFVIDSSNSMETNQAELVASFPEFVEAIRSTLVDVQSFHVGVVTSDAYQPNDGECDELGALVTRTGGDFSSDDVCGPFSDGARFMTEADDLPSAFSCAAQVGTDGANDEQMMAAMLAAVNPELNEAGECNEGFVRNDALLVVTLISDEDDPGTCVGMDRDQDCDGSPGDPDEWYEDLVAAKGVRENLVILSLTRGAPDNVCDTATGTERDGERIMDVARRHEDLGLIGDICESSFGQFFDNAVDLIQQGCEGFVLPTG